MSAGTITADDGPDLDVESIMTGPDATTGVMNNDTGQCEPADDIIEKILIAAEYGMAATAIGGPVIEMVGMAMGTDMTTGAAENGIVAGIAIGIAALPAYLVGAFTSDDNSPAEPTVEAPAVETPKAQTPSAPGAGGGP